MRVTSAPLLSAACHCRDCQKLTGGAYSLTLILPETGFDVISGASVIGGLHRPVLRHHFCPHCHNWLFTKAEAMPGFVNFRPTLLDQSGWVRPYVETKTAERLPGAVTGAIVSYEGWPPPEDFGRLTEAFAQNAPAWQRIGIARFEFDIPPSDPALDAEIAALFFGDDAERGR